MNHHRLTAIAALVLLSLTACPSSSFADEAADAKRYMRVRYDEQKQPLALETAIVRFEPAQPGDRPGLVVDLISAVHVGEKSYYEALNDKFKEYDVVLYELVAKEGTRIPKGGGAKDRNMLSTAQNMLKDLLQLEFQLAAIDYSKPNFVHADLTPAQFADSMKDKGESVWTMMLRFMTAATAQQAANPGGSGDVELLLALFERDRTTKLKRVMAQQFVELDQFIEAFTGPEGSTLITERNKAALKVLKREIDAGHKKIAIFYGGGHMADIQQRLIADFQLKPVRYEWLEAWNLRAKQ